MNMNMNMLVLSIFLISSVSNDARALDAEIPKSIKISAEEYAPFTSAGLKNFGVFSHIVSEAFRLEGITVEYEFFPAARSFFMAQTGDVVGTIPWAKKKNREIDFYYSDKILDVGRPSIFYKKGFKFKWNPKTEDYNDIKGLRVGVIISYKFGKAYQEAKKKGVFHVTEVSRLKQLFSMLLLNRIDIIFIKEWVARHVLQRDFTPNQITQVDFRPKNTLPPEYDYLLFSKKNSNALYYRKALNKGLKTLHESGEFEAIVKAFKKGDFILSKKSK